MFLPESLIALLLLQLTPLTSAEPQWPHNVPPHLKYFPEDEVHIKRSLSVQERLLNGEKPIGMKKMSADEGEMFFLDNWIFAGDEDGTPGISSSSSLVSRNSSISALSPLRPHYGGDSLGIMRRYNARAPLFARDFKCPTGTTDCSGIGAPNSCCGTGSTCVKIEDTGFGSVGCCGSGQNCAGTISCDKDNGYTSCPDSPNGGCCLPGYECDGVGCILVGTSITYVQPSTSARPSSTEVEVVPTEPPSSSTPSSSYTCSSGWHSCPASLGGGCCQSGRECASGASCLASSSTSRTSSQAPSAPIRPTGSGSSSRASTTSDAGGSLCPSGFYVCSAFYPSGCCRVGRDCQTTGSCAPIATDTVLNTNGVTIVAPTGAGGAAPQGGSCPTGWYSCAASAGGNCCPNGYSCGNVCTATSGGETSDKVAPSSATAFSYATIIFSVGSAVAIGVAMIVL